MGGDPECTHRRLIKGGLNPSRNTCRKQKPILEILPSRRKEETHMKTLVPLPFRLNTRVSPPSSLLHAEERAFLNQLIIHHA